MNGWRDEFWQIWRNEFRRLFLLDFNELLLLQQVQQLQTFQMSNQTQPSPGLALFDSCCLVYNGVMLTRFHTVKSFPV